ncbi:MAG: ATP-binding protein [Syntrophobacteraceae bacterium]
MEARERVQLQRILRAVMIVTLLLLAAGIYLGLTTSRQMKDIIREQFNQQQLVLASTAAKRIETNLQNAIADLVLLNSLSTIQYCDSDAYEALLLSTIPVLHRDKIFEISRVDREGNTMMVANDQGIAMQRFGLKLQGAAAYLSWAGTLSNRGKTMAAGIRPKDPSGGKENIVMDLITPTYEESTDKDHPRASQSFAGYLRVSVDISELLQDIMAHIRSGKTGYAWVLDSSGGFLYHPEITFIGENAFEVRHSRNPSISFNQINQIQRDEMLQGREGTGAYLSGWHRDVVEPMEKLIAYAPVRIDGPYTQYVWSVAVVAPVDELEGVVNMVYQRQMLLQGIIILVILIGSATVILYELRWSTILEHLVALKTRDLTLKAQALEESEANYRSLVEGAEDLIFTLDSDGIIQTANRHMGRLFGIEPSMLAGKHLHLFLQKKPADDQLILIREALKSGKGQRTETLFRIQDNDFWFNIQYMPLQVAPEGSDRRVLAIARDITDRKSLEKQLINTEKLASLGTLAAGVAHEINNPLGIILGFCDLLLEKIDPGTMEYNDLKTIERHGLHCKSIIERLLSFARISDEDDGECDVNENIETILSVVKHTLDMKNIDLVSRLAAELPMVKGDYKGLQQVLLNLINNAIYAMEGNGSLSIVTQWDESRKDVVIKVSDTGCGIKEEFLEKIFDPFFTTKKVGDGTGLGLSVSYGIISKMGGSIICDSRTEENSGSAPTGTTFTITLPVIQESA